MSEQADLLRETDALISDDGVYRYSLFRGWEKGGGLAVFVMLNPSTADALVNDPTVERCERYAVKWGYGALAVVNVYALRATDPKALQTHPDPVGPENDHHLQMHGEVADLIVCAWGNHGGERSYDVRKFLAARYPLFCLGLNKTGEPVHPLYQPKDAMPMILPLDFG